VSVAATAAASLLYPGQRKAGHCGAIRCGKAATPPGGGAGRQTEEESVALHILNPVSPVEPSELRGNALN
jgi:hypothetical protein